MRILSALLVSVVLTAVCASAAERQFDVKAAVWHLKPAGVWIKFWCPIPAEQVRHFIVEVGKRSNWKGETT